MGFLTGEKKSSSNQESKNLAYPYIQDTYGSTAEKTGGVSDALAALLGIGGDSAAQQTALENYSNSGGIQFLMDQGTKAITGSKAASGLLQSGSYGTALNKFGQGLGSTYLKDYLDSTFRLGDMGLKAGGLISGAGQYSKGTSKSSDKPGLGSMIGTVLTGLPMGG